MSQLSRWKELLNVVKVMQSSLSCTAVLPRWFSLVIAKKIFCMRTGAQYGHLNLKFHKFFNFIKEVFNPSLPACQCILVMQDGVNY